jgi:hypothetical protein
MNVVRAFAQYLGDAGVATLGRNLFISRVPSSKKLRDEGIDPNRIFWLKAGGGSPVSKSVNGSSTKNYIIEIYLRDLEADDVNETLQELGDDLSCAGCVTLEGYDVMEVGTNGPWSDQDLDNEERTVGLLQVTITIHKEC